MKKLFYFLFVFPIFSFGQSIDQNFEKTIVYKKPTTTSITNPTPDVAIVNVTYLDGFGRPIQVIANQQSASGKDIVLPIEYDAIGNKNKTYLPYSTQNVDMSFQVNAATDVLNYQQYQGQNPYSETLFEKSALNRVLKQAAPGLDWAMPNNPTDPDHTVKYEYLFNTVADKIKIFRAASSWNTTFELYDIKLINAAGDVFYDSNLLYKNVIKNENWISGNNNTTQEFRDKEGKIILKRAFENGVKHDTYYVYDQFGNLTYIIPPKADGSITDDVLKDLCFQYKYDYRNRLVEKKLPGKQWEFIVYDKLNRVVATGPANAPFLDFGKIGWMITKYDDLNRPILTGWMPTDKITSIERKYLQYLRNMQTNHFSETKIANATNTAVNGVSFRYSNVAFPDADYHVLTVNYYDDYNFAGAPSTIPITVLTDDSQEVYFNNTIKPKTLLTGTWVRALEKITDYNFEKSYYLYDNKARVVRLFKSNYLGGYTQIDSKLDFIGKTLYTETKHQRDFNQNEIKVVDNFSYSDQNRLITHTHKVNNELTQLLTKNEYSALGQLMNKKVGGNDINAQSFYQKIDYTYNIRGWLTGINDVGTLQVDNEPTDFFAFKINYNTVDNDLGGTIKPLYNGNIAETYWRTNNDNVLRKYGYQYDDLNRLKNAVYQKNVGGENMIANSYNESADYDKNGNVTDLKRNGFIDFDNGVNLEIDLLKYDYKPDSNLLLNVKDETFCLNGFKDGTNSVETNDFSYDENGNLVSDLNKNIKKIVYNHLNLPTVIYFPTGIISYIYNANGEKLKKNVKINEETFTDYLDGYQYKNGKLLFFPTAEGYVDFNGGKMFYVYNYTDHLGNVRVSYGVNPSNGQLKIIEENNYYPFGLKHENYNTEKYDYKKYENGVLYYLAAVEKNDYQYKFNGKEYQDELDLNLYDYGARNYDPAIGRWMNIDPLAETSRRISPFVYCLNNPVYFIDPDGMDEYSYDDEEFTGDGWIEKEGGHGVYYDPNVHCQEDLKNQNEKYLFESGLYEREDGVDMQLYDSMDSDGNGEWHYWADKDNDKATIEKENESDQKQDIDSQEENEIEAINIDIQLEFEKNTSDIVGGVEKLDKVITILTQNPNLNIEILGNANFPKEKFNENSKTSVNGKKNGTIGELQIERAKAIREVLIQNCIDINRLSIGKGIIESHQRSATIKTIK